MKLGLRTQLFLVSLLLIAGVGAISSVTLEHELRQWFDGRLEREVVARAATVRAAVRSVDLAPTVQAHDELADRLSQGAEIRVTLLDDSGKVMGDSSLDTTEVHGVESHAQRPEIIEALKTGKGLARRHSSTINTELLYVAMRYERGSRVGVVRLAKPLSEVEEAVSGLRVVVLITGAMGLALAIFVTFWASYLLSRRLGDLLVRASAIAEGAAEHSDGLPTGSGDEIAVLSRSLDRLDEALEDVVETLGRERDRFGVVLESMREAVIALDAENKITLLNRSAMRRLELKPSVVGKRLVDVIPSEELQCALEDMNDDDDSNLEIVFDGGDKRRTMRVRIGNVANRPGCVLVMRDVTRLRRLETMRRDFVANVSHELRTPVSVIRLNAEALSSGAMNDPENGPRFVQALLRNSERLSDLISDLLDISRIESGQYPVQSEALLLEPIVQRVIESVEPLAQERSIAIESTVPTALKVKGDAKALDHVLVNLIQNAVKYGAENGDVTVSAKPKGKRIRIEVRDNGPGIPEELRKRVFERFFRVDKGRSKHMGGTGLGLAIVKHLVLNMGGKVGVVGNEPTGACFYVELPADRDGNA